MGCTDDKQCPIDFPKCKDGICVDVKPTSDDTSHYLPPSKSKKFPQNMKGTKTVPGAATSTQQEREELLSKAENIVKKMNERKNASPEKKAEADAILKNIDKNPIFNGRNCTSSPTSSNSQQQSRRQSHQPQPQLKIRRH